MQEDPDGYVDGPNRYQYEDSDPINGQDPTGLTDQTGGHPSDTRSPSTEEIIEIKIKKLQKIISDSKKAGRRRPEIV
jgi:hypothetical protein